MSLICRQIKCDTPEYAAMLDLRDRILRRPIGRTLTPQETLRDKDDYLLGCFDGDELVGCLILQRDGDSRVKMRQVAVDDTRQGQGIGAFMLATAMDVARGMGVSGMYCHARETARDFYARYGWIVTSDTFDENGIPHCRMERAVEQTTAAV
jgi:predicted GNAT family N-acyltransferase